jgi:hypothetical protein
MPIGKRVEDFGKKRMLFCNGTDRGICPDLKRCRLPIGAESRERTGKALLEGHG